MQTAKDKEARNLQSKRSQPSICATKWTRGFEVRMPNRQGQWLRSWKEIAVYLHRDVRTVQRWEKYEDMPVHRQVHRTAATVVAFKWELDAWQKNRRHTRKMLRKPVVARRTVQEQRRILIHVLERALALRVHGCSRY